MNLKRPVILTHHRSMSMVFGQLRGVVFTVPALTLPWLYFIFLDLEDLLSILRPG